MKNANANGCRFLLGRPAILHLSSPQDTSCYQSHRLSTSLKPSSIYYFSTRHGSLHATLLHRAHRSRVSTLFPFLAARGTAARYRPYGGAWFYTSPAEALNGTPTLTAAASQSGRAYLHRVPSAAVRRALSGMAATTAAEIGTETHHMHKTAATSSLLPPPAPPGVLVAYYADHWQVGGEVCCLVMARQVRNG